MSTEDKILSILYENIECDCTAAVEGREEAAKIIAAKLDEAYKQLNDIARVVIAIPWGLNMVFDPTNLAQSLAARISAKLEPSEWTTVWYEKPHPSQEQVSDKWLAKDKE
jgi:hypothetical protein